MLLPAEVTLISKAAFLTQPLGLTETNWWHLSSLSPPVQGPTVTCTYGASLRAQSLSC
jgi:hypothetical protein